MLPSTTTDRPKISHIPLLGSWFLERRTLIPNAFEYRISTSRIVRPIHSKRFYESVMNRAASSVVSCRYLMLRSLQPYSYPFANGVIKELLRLFIRLFLLYLMDMEATQQQHNIDQQYPNVFGTRLAGLPFCCYHHYSK